MTQVIALAAPSYVILAADRRLTSVATGAVVADDRTKVVSLCNQTAIGFTGPAELQGEPTHLWIARRLADGECRGLRADSLWRAYSQVGNALQRLFADLTPLRSLEILATGWSDFPSPHGGDQRELAPYIATISNVQADAAGARAVTRKFRFTITPMFGRRERHGEPWGLAIVGADFGATLDHEQSRAERLLLACRSLIRRAEGPRGALRLLVREIQHTAEHGAQRCGVVPVNSSVLAVCIPLGSILVALRTGKPQSLANLELDPRWPYFADYDPRLDEFHQRGPLMVIGTAIMDVTYDRSADGTTVEASTTFIRAPSEPDFSIRIPLPVPNPRS